MHEAELLEVVREEVGLVEERVLYGLAHVDEVDVVVLARLADSRDVLLPDEAPEVRYARESDCEPAFSAALVLQSREEFPSSSYLLVHFCLVPYAAPWRMSSLCIP